MKRLHRRRRRRRFNRIGLIVVRCWLQFDIISNELDLDRLISD